MQHFGVQIQVNRLDDALIWTVWVLFILVRLEVVLLRLCNLFWLFIITVDDNYISTARCAVSPWSSS